jgi:3-methyl-2-oxobutanoate hydroxymethyltransferase
MVLLGYESTRQVTMRDMAHHTRPVAKAAKRALVVTDMPYQSFLNPEEALANAQLLTGDCGADAVKIEGGVGIERQVRLLVDRGVPVMGHIGMLPQGVANGKFRVYGKTGEEAEKILEDARLLDRLGVFAIVLECLPAELGRRITAEVRCPTIGIGAGPGTDGQILVCHDMIGIRSSVSPKFVRRYADVEDSIRKAAEQYVKDVTQGKYPSDKESFR